MTAARLKHWQCRTGHSSAWCNRAAALAQPSLRGMLRPMIRLLWSVRGMLFFAASAATIAAAETNSPAPSLPTVEQLFGLPNVRQPRLSPDGKKIAFLFPHEKKMALGVFDRATNESRMILRGEDESLYSF